MARAKKTPTVPSLAAGVPGAAPSASLRFDRVDALRGVAIVWMAGFHFCFDLNYFGFIHQGFLSDRFWTTQRSCIVTLFLLCAGVGQAIAAAQGQANGRFWRRWGQVAGCAVLVSFGSWLMFPQTFISFGVLHGIALMLIVVRFTSGWGLWRIGLGAIALALPHVVKHPFFDTRLTNWVGLVTHLPATEDWVPILPWLGVMWWGAVAADLLLRHRAALLRGPAPAFARPLAALGRWSLSFYMLHQPVLIGLVALAATILR